MDWDKIFALAYCFVAKGHLSLNSVSDIVGVPGKSVSQWWYFMREVCSKWIGNNPIVIGGPGIYVCLDETHLYKSMYGRGRELTDVWVFGGVTADPHPNEELQFFAFRVENRTVPTLRPIVEAHVAGGSLVMTDMARVYPALQRRIGHYDPQNNPEGWGDLVSLDHSRAEYAQHINNVYMDDDGVRHRHHVVITTNPLEIRWRWLKANISSIREFDDDEGDHIHLVDGYIDRYVYMCRV